MTWYKQKSHSGKQEISPDVGLKDLMILSILSQRL